MGAKVEAFRRAETKFINAFFDTPTGTDDRHFKAFCEIISATKPDVVIVWGEKVRGALFRKLAPTEKDFVSENRIRAEVGGHEFLLIAVRHPSQAFPQEKYREIFREYKKIRN